MSGQNHTRTRKILVWRDTRSGESLGPNWEERVIYTTSIRRALELLCGSLGFDRDQKVLLRNPGLPKGFQMRVLRPGGTVLYEPDGEHLWCGRYID